MKVLNRIIGFSAVFCVLCILFSLFFPGNIRFVDNIRLFFQKPLVRWAGKIHIKPVVSEDIDINLDELRDFIKDLPPGSIFFTRTRNYPLCELIPGEWKHSGVFLGTKAQMASHIDTSGALYHTLDTLMNSIDIYVLDSQSDGVSVHPIQELSNLNESSCLTHFAAFAFNGRLRQRGDFIGKALSFSGVAYDYDWITEDPGTVFCSELLYHSLRAVGLHVKNRTKTISRTIITPDDLFRYLKLYAGKRKMFTFYGSISKQK